MRSDLRFVFRLLVVDGMKIKRHDSCRSVVVVRSLDAIFDEDPFVEYDQRQRKDSAIAEATRTPQSPTAE